MAWFSSGVPAVIHGELVQPGSYPVLRRLYVPLNFRPVRFQQCDGVEFLPSILGLDIHVSPAASRELS